MGRDLCQGVIHVVVEYRIGGVDHHLFPGAPHQLSHGVENHWFLCIDVSGVGYKCYLPGRNRVFFIIGKGSRLGGGRYLPVIVIDVRVNGKGRTGGLPRIFHFPAQQFRIFVCQHIISVP